MRMEPGHAVTKKELAKWVSEFDFDLDPLVAKQV